MNRLLVVANPNSGRGRAIRKAEEFIYVANKMGFDPLLIAVDGKESMLSAIEEVLTTRNSKIFGLVAVGGDGLIHTLLPLLNSYMLPFTVLPSGTGNDFAREIGNNKLSNIEIVKKISSTPRPIDSLVIEGENGLFRACQVASLGFDAIVNERANSLKRIKGKIKYVFATIAELPLFKPITFHVEIDGVDFSGESMLIAVANGSCYGGGMKICPDAKIDDGLLDLLILSKVNIPVLLRVFPRVYRGTHISHPAIKLARGKKVRIEAPTKAYADGEFVSRLPIEISIDPHSLLVW